MIETNYLIDIKIIIMQPWVENYSVGDISISEFAEELNKALLDIEDCTEIEGYYHHHIIFNPYIETINKEGIDNYYKRKLKEIIEVASNKGLTIGKPLGFES